VVELVEIKLSAKSNKKFAVLQVSDGTERHELLIWSDVLMEHHDLMGENKLLGAVLIVDKRDPVIRIQSRAFIDLASAQQKDLIDLDEHLKKA